MTAVPSAIANAPLREDDFRLPDDGGEALEGALATRDRPADLVAVVRRLTQPDGADETVHWGRNYLFRTGFDTADGRRLSVVVKQFRNQGPRARLDRLRGRGCKATRSWRIACALDRAGVPTARPVMLVRSARRDGPSFFVSRDLGAVTELRAFTRAFNAGTIAGDFPHLDADALLAALGRAARRMHDAGIFHRDLSIGNVLLIGDLGQPDRPRRPRAEDLAIIDLNRARLAPRIGLWRRGRDLGRLGLMRRRDRLALLRAYWADDFRLHHRLVDLLCHRGFHGKIALKRIVRGALRGVGLAALGRTVRSWLLPRRAHAHIPPATAGAGLRDRSVWDALSDQPHQHAGRWQKTAVRLADAPGHLRHTARALRTAPRVWRRYVRLRRNLRRGAPVPWRGVGVCVRPHMDDPDALLAAIDDLGVRHVLLRLHPWDAADALDGDAAAAARGDAEHALAEALAARGIELAYSLPQNRDLVRDPARWRRAVAALVERFRTHGRHWQIGQAINRSKWGAWTLDEYLRLARDAAAIVRDGDPHAEVLGPAVIDFELHVAMAVLNARRAPHFDALAGLLYVDRRGQPENRQLGFDSVGKVLLQQAIADTARRCDGRSWITEINWPLWQGPHAPAGRSVAVDEQRQADYLARFYLLALTTGQVERVYWWRIVARGYGLSFLDADGNIARRPAFDALRTLHAQLDGCVSLGSAAAPAGGHLLRFRRADGDEIWVGWRRDEADDGLAVSLPRPVRVVVEQDGGTAPLRADAQRLPLAPSVRYAHLSPAAGADVD